MHPSPLPTLRTLFFGFGFSFRRVPSIQVRTNATKIGWGPNSYYEFNVPETESYTENNCKSATDCPSGDEGQENIPWTAVSKYAWEGVRFLN